MLLQTGQRHCYDENGQQITCTASGQDGEYRIGQPWPENRFDILGDTVCDRLTGLIWALDANPGVFPVTWPEALLHIDQLNQDNFLGRNDWRLPNRCELRSLLCYQSSRPALPFNHPFENVFLGWYWTSTSAAINPAYAWYVHMEGARMFYGRKDQYYLFWPVCGSGNKALRRSGQSLCYDGQGNTIDCIQSGQDGEYQLGHPWPSPRFVTDELTVVDRLTNLCWSRESDKAEAAVNWRQALSTIDSLNRQRFAGIDTWRLPNINELESLVDCSTSNPALPVDHPFSEIREGYWSSTTSAFETDWAWVLYMQKGACGVGYKPTPNFAVWPVCSLESQGE